MSVIENAKSKYAYYRSQISRKYNWIENDLIKIDLQISLEVKRDNLPFDFSFNIIYWGSPQAKSLSSKNRISYVLKILRADRSLSNFLPIK